MPQKSATKIPAEIKSQLNGLVSEFNRKNRADYTIRVKGGYVYFDRASMRGPVFRIRFNGAMNNWGFAIYKYSTNSYSSDEWFFPGSELVNGTVEGAMNAGLKAYPA